ncbi:hypothetical protein BXZ70DRAFT_590873 [Cristinia sonorae]|uniref:SET domain-containing protein n=1 Tax=Cristinia sonorae TaxID=1940300 RepID=A0A8K0UU66_9AGAR|nr:hypothetical protein BXZ70DRAFT_590873 [Cristinia sonorae]
MGLLRRAVQRGELILREKPLFLVPNKVHTSPGALLLSKLSTLSPRQRQQYYNLSYVHMPTNLEEGSPEYNEALALAIFQTNSIAADSNSGIFPRTARLNHGCSKAFNTIYTWRENEGALVLHALRQVKKGEELLTVYFDTKKPRDERRHYLKTMYGFECDCSVCSLPDELSRASDDRLVRISQLKSQFGTWANGEITGQTAVSLAREIWRLLDEEGYWSERGQLAADAAWVAASHSDGQATRQWAEVAQEWFGYELGKDSAQTQEMRKIVAQPMSHSVWGTRGGERVGGPGIALY